MKRPSFKSATKAIFGTLLLLATLALLFWWRTAWIPAGNVGVIYDASKGIIPNVYKPRAVLVGLRQELYIYPTKLQAAIYTQDPLAGENKTADGIVVTTNDNATTVFDVLVVYRINPDRVIQLFNEFGAISIELIQRNFIRRLVKEVSNEVGTQYDLFALMGAKRREASQKITERLREKLGPRGIEVSIAMLGGCYPSEDIQQKITSRVNSYVELEISRLKRQIAEIDRQVAVVRGAANAKATELTAAQTTGASVELLRLEAAELAIDRWDGNLSPISPKSGQTIVVTQELLKQLGGAN